MTPHLQLVDTLDTPPTLAGSRCVLRALRPGDARALQRHADDEAVRRNLFEGFPGPYTLADAQAWCGGGWRIGIQARGGRHHGGRPSRTPAHPAGQIGLQR